MKPFKPLLLLGLATVLSIFVTACASDGDDDDDDDHDHHGRTSTTTTTTVEERHVATPGAVQETTVQRY